MKRQYFGKYARIVLAIMKDNNLCNVTKECNDIF
jgi:hypothetical protein